MKLVLHCAFLTVLATALLSAQNFWQPVNNGLTEPIVRVIAVNAAGTIFTGTVSGAFSSTDHGNNWSYLTASGGVTVQTLWIDAAQRIYGGTEHGVFISTDNGASFSPPANGFPDTLVLAIATDENDHVFAGTDLGGLFRSTDVGATWSKLTNGLTSDNMTVLASLGGGLVLAGTDGQGMFRSTNDGDTWAPADSGLTDSTLYSITKKAGGIVFVGTNTGGVFRSGNFGQTWTQVNTGLTTLAVVSLVVHPNGDVYAGTSPGGVFKSTNNGNSWSEVNSGLTNLYVYVLAVDSSRYLFAGTVGDGDFRSVQPLTAVREPLARPELYSLSQNFPNPFNPTTMLTFVVPNLSIVTLRVYNALGSVVTTLIDGERIEPGAHEIEFNAAGLASGVYFYRLVAQQAAGGDAAGAKHGEAFVGVRKLVIVK
jgi:ligand-binding sensor domain-containing protein